MKTRSIFKRIGIVLGILLLIIVGLGLYVFSALPKTIGETPELQEELFNAPAQEHPVKGVYIYKTATELAAMIRSGEATSVEVVKEHIQHIKNSNWKYNALVWLKEEEALKQARYADAAVLRGDTAQPLLGVPVTVKEQFYVKGYPTTMNSKQITVIPEYDASLVTEIRRAGAVILGTTNLSYMVSYYQTYGEVYPSASNPYNTKKTPGGSTGGGAAALAAGFTTLELGADLGGSIRLPSVFCGLWGLKPGFGSLSLKGIANEELYAPQRMAMASPGPLARSAKDLTLFWNVLRRAKDGRSQEQIDWKAPSGKPLKDYRIGFADRWKGSGEDLRVGKDATDKLKELNFILADKGVHTRIETLEQFQATEDVFLKSMAHIMGHGHPRVFREILWTVFSKELKAYKPDLAKRVKPHFSQNTKAQWAEVQEERKKLTAQLDQYFTKYDFLITPAAYGPAIDQCEGCLRIPVKGGETISSLSYYGFFYAINATGHPALVVPMGQSAEGLPIGVQIVGPYHSEPELLYFAELLEPLIPGFQKPKD